jgi:hypothetical protein
MNNIAQIESNVRENAAAGELKTEPPAPDVNIVQELQQRMQNARDTKGWAEGYACAMSEVIDLLEQQSR